MYQDEGYFGEDIENVLLAAYQFTKGKFSKLITAADVGVDEKQFEQVVRAARERRHAQEAGGRNQLVVSRAGLRYAAQIPDPPQEAPTLGDEEPRDPFNSHEPVLTV